MQLITCPWCGPREEVEFHYGGQAHVAYPADPAALSDEQWAHYVFFRDNTKGRFAERWNHSHGCRRWFNAVRDTATYRFERVYRLDAAQAGDLMTSFRTAAGGRIDRDTTLEFTFDGQRFTGHPGDTLASALLAAGRHQIATSVKLGRPRGITAAWAEDSGGLVQIEEPFPEPMLLATTVELYDGLVAHGLPGQGRLADDRGPGPLRRACTTTSTCWSSAPVRPGWPPRSTAARAGARVALVDEQSEAGGALLSGTDELDGAPALDWVAAAVAELAGYPEVLHLQRTTAFGSYDDGFVLALERRTDHLGAAGTRSTSPASGCGGSGPARSWSRPAPTSGRSSSPTTTGPGIMLAGAARTFLHRYGVLPGREAVVFTTNDSAYDAALDLHRAGVRVQAVVDARPAVPARLVDSASRPGSRCVRGRVVTGTRGVERVTHALVAPFLGGEVGDSTAIACDLLLVSGGWNPAVHLFSQARGRLRYDDGARRVRAGRAARRPGRRRCGGRRVRPRRVPRRRPAGGPRGVDRLGFEPADEPTRRSPSEPGTSAAPLVLWRVPDTSGADGHHPVRRPAARRDGRRHRPRRRRRPALHRAHQALHHHRDRARPGQDLRRDRLGDHRRAARRSRCRTPGPPRSGRRTRRWPSPPWPAATAAGCSTRSGSPPCTTGTSPPAPCSRTSASGSARATTRSRGEDMEAAVLRECAAARTGVGILDGSTLGKIDVQGPDAGRSARPALHEPDEQPEGRHRSGTA